MCALQGLFRCVKEEECVDVCTAQIVPLWKGGREKGAENTVVSQTITQHGLPVWMGRLCHSCTGTGHKPE